MFGRSKSEKPATRSIDGMKGQRKKAEQGQKPKVSQPDETILDAKVLPWKPDPAVEEAEQKAAQDKAQAEIQQNRIISFLAQTLRLK